MIFGILVTSDNLYAAFAAVSEFIAILTAIASSIYYIVSISYAALIDSNNFDIDAFIHAFLVSAFAIFICFFTSGADNAVNSIIAGTTSIVVGLFVIYSQRRK